MRLSTVLSVFAGLVVSGTAAMGAQMLEQQDLFRAGIGGYHTYRIPSVVATGKGTLIAFIEGRKNDKSDFGDIDTLAIRSTNDGRTWSKFKVIADHGAAAIHNPTAVQDRSTGTIWLVLTGKPASFTRKTWEAAGGEFSVWTLYSKDDGVTWSKPVEITRSIRGKQKDQTRYANGPGNGIQLRSGRLVIPVWYYPAGTQTSYATVMYSDDHGKTWAQGNAVGPHTNEAQAVELADGRLMLNCRSSNGAGKRAVALSSDGGETWTKPAYDETLIEPGCQASLLRYSLEPKKRVLFSNPASQQDRVNMTVRVSYDEGRSWPTPMSRQLHEGPCAYSALVVLRDGTIGCFYERGDSDRYEKVTFARFNLEWLTNGQDR